MNVIKVDFPHKTASMFAHYLLERISKLNNIKYYSTSNTPDNSADVFDRISKPEDITVIYGPNRDFKNDHFDLLIKNNQIQCLTICQIRDPLDLIVSQYFSHGWIHGDKKWNDAIKNERKEIQEGKVSIYDYALREIAGKTTFGGRSFIDKYNTLYELMNAEGKTYRKFLLIKYEDMVLDYNKWSNYIIDFLPMIESKIVFQELNPKYKKNLNEDDIFYEDTIYYANNVMNHEHKRAIYPNEYKKFFNKDEITSLREIINGKSKLLSQYY